MKKALIKVAIVRTLVLGPVITAAYIFSSEDEQSTLSHENQQLTLRSFEKKLSQKNEQPALSHGNQQPAFKTFENRRSFELPTTGYPLSSCVSIKTSSRYGSIQERFMDEDIDTTTVVQANTRAGARPEYIEDIVTSNHKGHISLVFSGASLSNLNSKQQRQYDRLAAMFNTLEINPQPRISLTCIKPTGQDTMYCQESFFEDRANRDGLSHWDAIFTSGKLLKESQLLTEACGPTNGMSPFERSRQRAPNP